jgi:thioredoxin reductase
MARRLLVVGGDAAGMSAASAARRLAGPDELEIVAFERDGYTSYSACGIPYYIGTYVQNVEALIARSPDEFATKQAIEARTGHEVTELDLNRRAVRVRDLGSGTAAWEGFDELMLATGAAPRRPDLPGADAAGIFGVQTLDKGRAVRAFLERRQPRREVVVGAGYIGLKLAEALCGWGVHVTVVDSGPAPMSTLEPDMGAMLTDAMRSFGMTLRHGTTMDVEANYTDSHGQSEIGFGITRLLNFDLLPRIKRINKVKLYRPVAGEPDAYPQLTPALTRPIRWELIAQQYDQMIKYATAIRTRTASTEAILRRFTRNASHPTYAAMLEVGRVQKTIFVARYLRLRDLQREIEEGLNVMESSNGANSVIAYGKDGEIASNRRTSRRCSCCACGFSNRPWST